MSYLKEKGDKSSARLIFTIGSFWAMAITTYLVVGTSNSPAEILAFYAGVQGTLVGLKLGQKTMETKDEKKPL